MEFASTGISGLDGHFGGGIPRGTTVLVISEPDNALPSFCEQFAGGGVNGGEHIVYFELDRPATNLRKDIASHAIHAEQARKATLRVYDGYASQFAPRPAGPAGERPGSFATPLARGELYPSILREIQSAQPRGYRLIVESLSSVVTERSEDEALEFMRTLTYLGSELGGVHLVCVVKGLHSPRFEAHLRHLAGGVMELGVERRSFGLYPYLYVSKLLNVKDPVRIFPVKDTEKGLAIETARRL